MEKRVGKLMADDCIGADGWGGYPFAPVILPFIPNRYIRISRNGSSTGIPVLLPVK